MSQQSQTDFLLEVSGWSREKCISNLDTALPAVIDHLENAAYIEDGLKTLRVLCDYLLPCVDSNALEDEVFLKISKHVNGLVDGALNKIHLNLRGALKDNAEEEEELSSIVEECLQWMQELGACLECCLRSASDCVTSPNCSSIELGLVKSVPECALHYLRGVYRHCKESNEMYGDQLLHSLSDALSSLFKRAHSVQMLLLGLLDKISIRGPGLGKDVVTMCAICSRLFDVCTLVTSLDVKLSISLWKSISRLCNQHLTLLRDRLAVCPFITFLCEEIKQGYHYLFQLSPNGDPQSLSQGDDKAFSKSVRIVGFQMKVVVALLRDFADYLGESERSVVDLLLYLHRHLPPCLSASPLPEKQEADVRAHIVNATVPCLTHLMGNRAFRVLLTQGVPDGEPEDKLPRLLLQLMVLDVLPKCDGEVIDSWFQPVKHSSSPPNILSAIFSSAKHCGVEMKLPVMLQGVVAAGQPQRQVNFYEHTVTHICGMIGACPARHFNTLESVLMTQVCGRCDLLSMMAVDCWCFLARFGTASVCNSQVQGLVCVYMRLVGQRGTSSSQRLTQRLSYLLSRLIKFMSPEHQMSLVQQYPPEVHTSLWLALKPAGLSTDAAKDVTGRLVSSALSVLTGGGSVKAKASQLCLSLELLTELYTTSKPDKGTAAAPSSSSSSSLSPQQQAQLLQVVTNLWDGIRTSLPSEVPSSTSTPMPPAVRVKLLYALLPMTTHLLALMEAKDLIVILQSLESLLNQPDCCTDLALASAHFLSGLGHVKLGCSFMDCQALDLMPRVFHLLLRHGHPMVHQQALAAFSQFISLTRHEETVPACLKGDEGLTKAVQDYINQVPHQALDSDFNLLDYLREAESQAAQMRDTPVGDVGDGKDVSQRDTLELLFDDEEDLFEQQPAKKRKAVMESDEESLPPPSPQSPDNSPKPLPRLPADSSASKLATSSNPGAEADLQSITSAASSSSSTTSTTTKVDMGRAAGSTTTATTTATASRPMPTTTLPTAGSETTTLSTTAGQSGNYDPPGSDGHLHVLLDRLTDLAGEMEKAAEAAMSSGGLPQWFVDAALVKLTACRSNLGKKDDCWLDDLS